MLGTDGKKYTVPANYASKSKLVQGDILKLRIAPEGDFIYKVVAPIDREKEQGVLEEHGAGDYRVVCESGVYRVLLASVYYFKAEPGDLLSIILPKNQETEWAAIEKIKQRKPAEAPKPKKPKTPAKKARRKKTDK
jgi:hypothetical protein